MPCTRGVTSRRTPCRLRHRPAGGRRSRASRLLLPGGARVSLVPDGILPLLRQARRHEHGGSDHVGMRRPPIARRGRPSVREIGPPLRLGARRCALRVSLHEDVQRQPGSADRTPLPEAGAPGSVRACRSPPRRGRWAEAGRPRPRAAGRPSSPRGTDPREAWRRDRAAALQDLHGRLAAGASDRVVIRLFQERGRALADG